MKTTLLWLATALALMACSGNGHESSVSSGTTGSGTTGTGGVMSSSGSGGAAVLPACTWPTSFDPVDAGGDGQCTAGRAFLSCAGPGGVQMLCLSDNAAQCPNPGDGYTCEDECHPDEFGAGCGHIGPGEQPPPPAGCRSVGQTPAGPAFYCCPCGS